MRILSIVLSLFVTCFVLADDYTLAAYYWPDYHREPRMEAFLGKGWTEYQMIAASKPKYPGHYQPRVPAWGPLDESDPKVMEKKIDAAADHGINCFIMDWYWYENEPFLEAALNDGLMKAPNRNRIKFALMWANHTFIDIFPKGRPGNKGTIWPGECDRKTFDSAIDHILAQGYLKQPNYWRVDGKLYFSIYEVSTLIKGLGGVKQTRDALDDFRRKVREAGLGKLHLNAVLFQLPELPSAVPGEAKKTKQETLDELGFDSVTSYTWAHSVWPAGHYEDWAKKAEAQWDDFAKQFTVPYFPNVSIGWDNNARMLNETAAHINDSTPEKFRAALVKAKEWLDAHPKQPKVITLNAWNEWPEGSYLEPDKKFGMQYLDAVKEVFPPSSAQKD
jgi:hypothetical protein